MHNNKGIVIQFQTDVANKLKGTSVELSDYFTEDAQWHLPASLDHLINGADRNGKAAVLDLLDTAVKRCYKPETMRFDFHSMITDKDYVHQHFTMTAETANSKAYKSGYQTLFQLRDGKISSVWEYFDSGLLLTLLNQKG